MKQIKPKITVNKRFKNVKNTVKFIDFVEDNKDAFINSKIMYSEYNYNMKVYDIKERILKRIYIQKNLKIVSLVGESDRWPNSWTFSIFDCIIIFHQYSIDIYRQERDFNENLIAITIEFDKNYIRGLKLLEL